MRLKRKAFEDVEINVGSFADIAFLLIIFFILATTLIKPTGRPLDMPASTKNQEMKDQKQLMVVLSPGTSGYGDTGKVIDIDELRQILVQRDFPNQKKEDRIVIVESNPKVPYTEWFQVVMAISRAGGILGMMEEEISKTE